MPLNLDAFRQSFIDEAREHVATMESGLLQLEHEPGNFEILHAVFRAAHSIKGAAGTLGFVVIAEHTHLVETVLDAMRQERIASSPEVISTLLAATDDLRALVTEALGNACVDPDPTRLRALLETSEAAIPLSVAPPGQEAVKRPMERRMRVTISPSADFFRTGLDPILLFRDLGELGRIEGVVCDFSHVPEISALDPSRCYVAWTAVIVTDVEESVIRDVFVFVEDNCRITIQCDSDSPVDRRRDRRSMPPPMAAHAAESATLRVSSEKVDSIIDLVGELVIAQSMVMQQLDASSLVKTPTLRDAMGSFTRNMQELQERVMNIRMVPVSNLFGRFARMVRDSAASLGKTVELSIEGQDTEIDKAVIERLADPVTHLVRNALDHGLETTEERIRARKDAPATIGLSARHIAGGVVIAVSDNGRGLDVEAIRRKADQIGLTNPTDVLSDEHVQSLIFEAGFSTASKITDLSGRGVGMDVVRRCIDSLNGTISITTAPGYGTTFEIRLPLTLAILDGLLLRVEQQTYVLPLLAVTESFRPKRTAVKHVTGEGTVAILRDSALPLVDLGSEFGMCDRRRDPAEALVVVVEADGKRVGLVVDSLIGQSQVVIKSIEKHYRRVDGVMGATILGDGKVAFIVDVSGLVRLAWARRTGQEPTKAA